MPNRSATRIGFAIVTVAVLATLACSRTEEVQTRVYRMGERVQVGPLIYSVLDTEWRTQLGEGAEMRTPKNRYLILQLTVTNSGGKEIALPPTTLEDSTGKSYREEPYGTGVSNWLGLLRKLAPAQTDQGRLLFDAPPGAYRLRVTDDNPELGKEKFALIDIPLRLEPEPAPQVLKDVPEAPAPAPR